MSPVGYQNNMIRSEGLLNVGFVKQIHCTLICTDRYAQIDYLGRYEAKYHLASLFVEIFCQNYAFIKFQYSFDRIFQQRD